MVEAVSLKTATPMPRSRLFGERRVPEWINVYVMGRSDARTIIKLEACGRYSNDDRTIYFRELGAAPRSSDSAAGNGESDHRFLVKIGRLPRFHDGSARSSRETAPNLLVT